MEKIKQQMIKQRIEHTKKEIKELQEKQNASALKGDLMQACNFIQQITHSKAFLKGMRTALNFLEEENGK